MNWLDTLNSKLTLTRGSTRERITAVADNLAEEIVQLTLINKDLQIRLTTSLQLVAQLQQENALLKN